MQESLCENIKKFIKIVSKKRDGILLSLDLGAKKVGVAKGSMILKIATPLMVINYNNQRHLAGQLRELIKEHKANGLVIGLPNENLKDKFTSFVDEMKLGLPYIFEDESHTTKLANSMLQEVGLKRKKRNKIDDKISAQIILNALFAKT